LDVHVHLLGLEARVPAFAGARVLPESKLLMDKAGPSIKKAIEQAAEADIDFIAGLNDASRS